MSSKFTITDTVPLPNSTIRVPRLGFGVYEPHGRDVVAAVLEAFKAGYRHIDTAQDYTNEKEVGTAFRQSGLRRSEVFITTKTYTSKGSLEATYEDVLNSVKTIDGDDGYVDLFLVHSPDIGSASRKEIWLALEKLSEDGKAKAIGVSNYSVGHIEEMKGFAKFWPPMVNQIELHPWCQQRELVEYCQRHGIVISAYCPLVKNTKAEDPTLLKIAKNYNVEGTQVLVRYCLQKGWTPLPKSATPARILQNADVYGFELNEEEMTMLDDLDQGLKGSILGLMTEYSATD